MPSASPHASGSLRCCSDRIKKPLFPRRDFKSSARANTCALRPPPSRYIFKIPAFLSMRSIFEIDWRLGCRPVGNFKCGLLTGAAVTTQMISRLRVNTYCLSCVRRAALVMRDSSTSRKTPFCFSNVLVLFVHCGPSWHHIQLLLTRSCKTSTYFLIRGENWWIGPDSSDCHRSGANSANSSPRLFSFMVAKHSNQL